MSFSDETLMAFADGELDDITRHEVELAMRLNPDIAQKVERHKALRARVFRAFTPVLDEAVPEQLQAALRSGKVVQLDSVRPLRVPPPPPPVVVKKAGWGWREWGGIAATLVVGVLAGSLGARSLGDGAALAAVDAGTLKAKGELTRALNQQLASAPVEGQVRVGISFVDKTGAYCRSFLVQNSAGLACREGQGWRIPVMVDNLGEGQTAYRQAGTAMPAAVLGAIDERIAGVALDAEAEAAAQARGWHGK